MAILILLVGSGMTVNERLCKKRWSTRIVKREGRYDIKGREKEDGEVDFKSF